MSGVSAAGGSNAMPLAQAPMRAALAERPAKPEALSAERSLRTSPAKAAAQAARAPAPERKPDAAAPVSQLSGKLHKTLGPETPQEAFASAAQALGQRGQMPPAEDKAASAARDSVSVQEALQDKMLRQITKMKQAYSHIQAHTGDSKADASLNMLA